MLRIYDIFFDGVLRVSAESAAKADEIAIRVLSEIPWLAELSRSPAIRVGDDE